MTLTMRLWLSGAVLPVIVMASVLFVADQLATRALANALDRALLAQAAIESVSLFDGPRGEPHLHMAVSPLVESVRGFAPEGFLFGPDGAEVMRYPPSPNPSAERGQTRPGTPNAPPILTTHETPHGRARRLEVTVMSPAGEPYLLRLDASMNTLDSTQGTVHRFMIGAMTVVTVVLVLVQLWQARSLRRRLAELSEHAEALRVGDLDHALEPERERDEVASLRALIVEATTALRLARDGKARLLADAAHELRTPLTLMRTSLDLALRRERTTAELKLALRDTRDEVDRLALLATRLLDSAALSHRSGAPERCDVVRLAREAVEAARPSTEARALRLSLEAPAELTARLRPQAVRQALDNLLSNAMRYAQSQIVVRVERAPDGRHIALHVFDDGPGIPPEEREPVFEPFHRVQHGGAGAGLGLAIVREAAHAHRGRAYVAPSERGAHLVIELSALDGDAQSAA